MTRQNYIFKNTTADTIRARASAARQRAAHETRRGIYFDTIRANDLASALFWEQEATYRDANPDFQGWFRDSDPAAQLHRANAVTYATTADGNTVAIVDPSNPSLGVGGTPSVAPAPAPSSLPPDSTPPVTATGAARGPGLLVVGAIAVAAYFLLRGR